MSSAPVRQTAPGTFAASISPPPSGVVATTSNVGSSIVSARAFAGAAARTATPSGPQSQGVQRAILSLPPAVCVGSLRTSTRYTARPPDRNTGTLIAPGGSFQLFESTPPQFP